MEADPDYQLIQLSIEASVKRDIAEQAEYEGTSDEECLAIYTAWVERYRNDRD